MAESQGLNQADRFVYDSDNTFAQQQNHHQMLQTPEILLRSVVDPVIMDEDDCANPAYREPHDYYYKVENSNSNAKHFSAEHTPYERIINGNVILTTSTGCNSNIFGAGDCASTTNYAASSAYFNEDALVAAMHNDCASAFAEDIINHATAACLSPLQFSSYTGERRNSAANSKGSVVLRLCNEQQFHPQYDSVNDGSSLFYTNSHRNYRDDEKTSSPSSSATPEPTMLVVKPPMSPASTTPALSSSTTHSSCSNGQHTHKSGFSAANPSAATETAENLSRASAADGARVEKQNMLERLGYKLRLPKLPPATLYDSNYRQRIVEANRFWQTSLASHITIWSCRNYLLHHHQNQQQRQNYNDSRQLLFTNGGAGEPAALTNANFPSLQELQHHLPKPHGLASSTQLNIEAGGYALASNVNYIGEQDLIAVNRTGRLSDSGYFGRRVRARARKLTAERRLVLSTAMQRSNQQHAAIIHQGQPSSSSSSAALGATIEQALSQPNTVAASNNNNSDCMYEFEVHELSEATLSLLSAIYERLQTHLSSIAQQASQKALQNSSKVVALSILKNVRQAIENVVEVFDNVEGQRAAQQNSSSTDNATTTHVFSNSKTFSGLSASRNNRNLSLLFILYMPMAHPETLCLRCIIPLLNAHAPTTQPTSNAQKLSLTTNNGGSSLTNVPSWPKLNNPNNLLSSAEHGKVATTDALPNTAPEKASQQQAGGIRKQIGVVTRPLTLSSWGEIYFKDESDAREDNLRNTIMPFGFAQLSAVFKNRIIVSNDADPNHVVINCGQVLEFKIATSGLYQPLATFSDFTPLDLLYPNLSLHDRYRGVLTRLFRHLDLGYVYSPYHEKMFSFHLCDVMYDMAPPRVGDAVEFTLRRVVVDSNTSAASTTALSPSASAVPTSSAVTFTACDVLTLPEGGFGRVRVEDEKHYNGAVVRAANAEHNQAGIIELRLSSFSSTSVGNNQNVVFHNSSVSSSTSMTGIPLLSSASSSSQDVRQNNGGITHVTSANSSTDCMPTTATAKSYAVSMGGGGPAGNKRFAFYEHSFEYDQSSIADVGYVVSFRLLHDPFSSRDLFGHGIAINLKIEAGLVRKRGHILALFDNYGFIELDSREDAWFHFSRLINCRADELFIGCPVEYSLLPKLPEKPTQQACYVRRLRKDGIVGYDRLLSQQTFRGEVLQAMRAVTPFQKQYFGKIAVYGPTTAITTSQSTNSSSDNNNSGSGGNSTLAAAADEIITRLTTPGADNSVIFTFSGLCDKRDHLRIGDIVSFKLATFRTPSINLTPYSADNNQTTTAMMIEPRAVDISRIMFRLRVRNIKRVDQFGFLDFYGSDLFFHLSHVSDGDAIKPGDIVECVVRRDRTQRPCATSVVRRFWGKKALAMQESNFWLHTPQDLIVRDIINMRSGTTSAGVPPSSVVNVTGGAASNNGPQPVTHTPQRILTSSVSNHHPVQQQQQRQHFYRSFSNNNNNFQPQPTANTGYRQLLNNANNSNIALQMLRSLSSSTNHSNSTNNLALLSTASSPYPGMMMPALAAAAAAEAAAFQQPQMFAANNNGMQQQLPSTSYAQNFQPQQQPYAGQVFNQQQQQQFMGANISNQQQQIADLSLYYQQLRSAESSRASGALQPLMAPQPQQPQQFSATNFQQTNQQQHPATAAELLELAPLLAPFAAYYQQQLQLQQQQQQNNSVSMAAPQQQQQQQQYVDMAYYNQQAANQQQQLQQTNLLSTGQQLSQQVQTNNNFTTASLQPYQVLSHAQQPLNIQQQQPSINNTMPVNSISSLQQQQQQQQPLPLWRRRDDNGNGSVTAGGEQRATTPTGSVDYSTMCALRTFQQQQHPQYQLQPSAGNSYAVGANFIPNVQQTSNQLSVPDNGQQHKISAQPHQYRLQLSSPTGSPSCLSLNRTSVQAAVQPRASASAVSAYTQSGGLNANDSSQRSSRLAAQNNYSDANNVRIFGATRKLDRSRSVDRAARGGGGDNGVQYNLMQTALQNNNNNANSNNNVPTSLCIGDFSTTNGNLAAKVNTNGSVVNPGNLSTNLM